MVTATVNFYGVIRHLMDQPRATVLLPGEFTLQDVVDALEALYGRRMREEMISSGNYIHSHVKVFVDGQDVRGDLSERFGPYTGTHQLDIYLVPMSEGGRE